MVINTVLLIPWHSCSPIYANNLAHQTLQFWHMLPWDVSCAGTCWKLHYYICKNITTFFLFFLGHLLYKMPHYIWNHTMNRTWTSFKIDWHIQSELSYKASRCKKKPTSHRLWPSRWNARPLRHERPHACMTLARLPMEYFGFFVLSFAEFKTFCSRKLEALIIRISFILLSG